jgi:murein DD-endopeptidase MepM/ murein hydrolase activator NlpD
MSLFRRFTGMESETFQANKGQIQKTSKNPALLIVLLIWLNCLAPSAQPFFLPTANRAIFEPGREEAYFVGTVGKPWASGLFGCVRSEGKQLHEGIDIKCLKRDKKGEPADPVMATADGVVAYANRKSSLSNYGNYLIVQHQVEGLKIYSLYAHLGQIPSDLRVGQAVKAGQNIAIMGRTANTKQAISKERAHVHFELTLLINDRFPSWFKRAFPDQRNDHGMWNGQNLVGLDPRLILLEQQRKGAKFSLLHFVRHQHELCRVLVRKTRFPWLYRYPLLVRRNAVAEKEGFVGYEIALAFNGLPIEMVPRAAREINSQAQIQLHSVNEAEQQKHPCRRLVTRRSQGWALTQTGLNLLELLIE